MSISSYGKMAGQRAFNVLTPVKKDENSLHKFIALKDFFNSEFDDFFLINVYSSLIFPRYSEGLGLLRIRNGRGV